MSSPPDGEGKQIWPLLRRRRSVKSCAVVVFHAATAGAASSSGAAPIALAPLAIEDGRGLSDDEEVDAPEGDGPDDDEPSHLYVEIDDCWVELEELTKGIWAPPNDAMLLHAPFVNK